MTLISREIRLAVPVLLVFLLAVTSVFALYSSNIYVANYGTIRYSWKAYQSELRGVLVQRLVEFAHNDTLICETLSKYGFNAVYLEINPFAWTGYAMSAFQSMINACKVYNLTFHVLLTVNAGTGPGYPDSGESEFPYGFTGYRSNWVTKLDDGSTATTISFSSTAARDRLKQVVLALLTYFPAIIDLNLDYIRYTDYNYRVPYDDASKTAFQTWLSANGKTFTGNWADYYHGGSHWRDFAQWRCVPINDIVRDIQTWAKQVRPAIMISADVFTPWSGDWTPDLNPEVIGQDVAYWISQGYIDSVNPMNYVPNLAELQYRIDSEATYWLGQLPRGAIPLVPFITQGGPGSDVGTAISNATFVSQINYLRTSGCNGFIIWKYEGPGFVTGEFTKIEGYLQLINKSSTKGTFTTFDQYVPSVSGSVITWITTVNTTGSAEYSTSPIFPAIPYVGTLLDYINIDYSAGTVLTNSNAATQHAFTVPISPPFYYRVRDNDSNIVLASPVYLVTG